MEEVNKLKEELIERYNMSWEGPQDNLGVVQAAKDNFRNLMDLLITKAYKAGQNK